MTTVEERLKAYISAAVALGDEKQMAAALVELRHLLATEDPAHFYPYDLKKYEMQLKKDAN